MSCDSIENQDRMLQVARINTSKSRIMQIQSRVVGGGLDITVVKEGTERELIDWVWNRYPLISQFPIGDWFIPDPSVPIQIAISAFRKVDP